MLSKTLSFFQKYNPNNIFILIKEFELLVKLYYLKLFVIKNILDEFREL